MQSKLLIVQKGKQIKTLINSTLSNTKHELFIYNFKHVEKANNNQTIIYENTCDNLSY